MAQTPVPPPVLDPRNEDLLAAEAIGQLPAELSDRSDSSPAVTLLEGAAWLVGKMLFQINNWPASVIQKTLALIGVNLLPATAGQVVQTFALSSPQGQDTVIPAGTRVATLDGSIIYATLADLAIQAYAWGVGAINLTAGSVQVTGTYAAGAGTISVVQGSTAVVGTGTAFTVGWIGGGIKIAGVYYQIAGVTDATHLTLAAAYAGATAGALGYSTGTYFVPGASWVGYQIRIRNAATWYTIASVIDPATLTLTATASTTATGAFDVGPVTGSVPAQATAVGAATTVGAGKLVSIQLPPGSLASSIASTTNAAGTPGTDPESIASAIARAPSVFASRDMAVLPGDYAYFAQKILGAGGRAKAQGNTNVTAPVQGYVSLACLSPSWTQATPVSAVERAAVVRDLAGRTLVGSVTIDLPASIYPCVPAVAYFRPGQADAASSRAAVAAALNSLLSPNTYPWGRPIYQGDLIGAVEAVPQLDRVHTIAGVAAISTQYQAATPAPITFAAGNTTYLTAHTTGMQAGKTFLVDATNNAVYLVVALVTDTSVTLDRQWTGALGAASPPWFNASDADTMNGLWYDLPLAALSTDPTNPAPSLIVVGSV